MELTSSVSVAVASGSLWLLLFSSFMACDVLVLLLLGDPAAAVLERDAEEEWYLGGGCINKVN